MEILANPYFYQFSVLLLDLKKINSVISRKLGPTLGKRTLDVCCGTGNFAGAIDGEYIGFDSNPNYIIYAQNRFKKDKSKKFLISDIENFDFKPKYFDNVLLISALHHFPEKVTSKLLRKINDAVKDKVIIIDPAIETENHISRLLILLDRGKFIRPLKEQIDLISKNLNIIEHFTSYSGLAHQRIIVCKPKDDL